MIFTLVVLSAAPHNAFVTLDDHQVTSRADARLDGKSGLDQFLWIRYDRIMVKKGHQVIRLRFIPVSQLFIMAVSNLFYKLFLLI